MHTAYESLCNRLADAPQRWLVTGGAGFIGSHLTEKLLSLGQQVVAFDNFSTGHRANLDCLVTANPEWADRLRIFEGDLENPADCLAAAVGVDHILHQGALGSVPRSIKEPLGAHGNNATGTLNLFEAARKAGVKRVVYASSSAVYGDEPNLPKVEDRTGNLLSPYAATKAVDEIYANAYSRAYGMEFAGLRYFNVFGPRQDPGGPYAAVIPIWVSAMLRGESVGIYGDGETTRDFTYVANVVQANLLAATTPTLTDPSRVFNVAIGGQTSLNELFAALRDQLLQLRPGLEIPDPVHRDFRPGDVRHSLADFSRARDELGFVPTHDLATGLALAMEWYAAGSAPAPH